MLIEVSYRRRNVIGVMEFVKKKNKKMREPGLRGALQSEKDLAFYPKNCQLNKTSDGIGSADQQGTPGTSTERTE